MLTHFAWCTSILNVIDLEILVLCKPLLAGTLSQRLNQLREAFTFVVACNGCPPFRATKVQRQPNGRMMELLSWPSGGPHEDNGTGSELQAAYAELPKQPHTAAVLAAAAAADAGCRMVVGGEGWQGPHLHGQGIITPATVAQQVAGSSILGSVICGDTPSDNDYTSDGEEVGKADARSVSPLVSHGIATSRCGGKAAHGVCSLVHISIGHDV
jgi:hypothetical protein